MEKQIKIFNLDKEMYDIENKIKGLKDEYSRLYCKKQKISFKGFSNFKILFKAIDGWALNKDMKWERVQSRAYDPKDYIYEKIEIGIVRLQEEVNYLTKDIDKRYFKSYTNNEIFLMALGGFALNKDMKWEREIVSDGIGSYLMEIIHL